MIKRQVAETIRLGTLFSSEIKPLWMASHPSTTESGNATLTLELREWRR